MNSDSASIPSSRIEALCDLVPNPKRDEKDFQMMLRLMEHQPKECTPFKGKILQHLKIHALGNPNANLDLLAISFARATLLFRKTPNKSEGPLGCWKSGLSTELKNLEANLDQLYQLAGVNTNTIIVAEEDEFTLSKGKLDESRADFESIINEHLLEINWSAKIVCALITAQTDFNIPIPIQVILRLSAKLCYLRWRDYRKRPNGLIKAHVFSLTPYLIEISISIFRSMIKVLRTNIIPFMPFINRTLIGTLQWTRSSRFWDHDGDLHLIVRSQLFKLITFIAEQLSLNMNLEPSLLKDLLREQIFDEVDQAPYSIYEDRHEVDALICAENILIIYWNYLDAELEGLIKSYVINSCIRIYRDFGASNKSSICRKQLLEVLLTIANQPFATSTTELAYHIFELAERLESEPSIRSLASRALKTRLAHKPTIVTRHEVYNFYNRPMSAKLANGDSSATKSAPNSEQDEKVDSIYSDPMSENLNADDNQADKTAPNPEVVVLGGGGGGGSGGEEVNSDNNHSVSMDLDTGDNPVSKSAQDSKEDEKVDSIPSHQTSEDATTGNNPTNKTAQDSEEDEEVNSIMRLFVEKKA